MPPSVPSGAPQVLDLYEGLGWLGSDPYWAYVWPSAMALAQELLQRPELVRGRRVLDLGCGVGLAGIAAAVAGAREVVLADREPRALHCALAGALANGLPVAPPAAALRVVDGMPMPPLPPAARAPPGGRARGGLSAAVVDWHRPETVPGPFDVVLACDVLYEKASVAPLAALVARLFPAAAPGVFVLADPPNRTPANRRAFVEQVGARGGRVALAEEGRRRVRDSDGALEPVELVLFRGTGTAPGPAAGDAV